MSNDCQLLTLCRDRYSLQSLGPCTICDYGEYTDRLGALQPCDSCGETTLKGDSALNAGWPWLEHHTPTTVEKGSTSRSDCIDIVGYFERFEVQGQNIKISVFFKFGNAEAADVRDIIAIYKGRES